MRRAIAMAAVMMGVCAAGCQAVIGLHDYVVDGAGGGTGGTMSTGGGGTGGLAGGGTGGQGGTTTGGTGGTGGSVPFACTPAGVAFDMFDATADKPSSDAVFLVSVPGALPPRVHAVRAYETEVGHLSVRTMKSIGMLSPVVAWDAPTGASRFRQGRVNQNHVSVQGYVTTAMGPTVGEVQFSLGNEQTVQEVPAPQWVELPAPADCPALSNGASVKALAFANEGEDIHFTATYDDCLAGVRRLYYYTPADGLTKLREGMSNDGSLMLSNHVRNGDEELLVFFSAPDAAVSGGKSIGELQVVAPVDLGDPATNQTSPLAAVPAGASGFALFWLVVKNGPALPGDLYGGAIQHADVAQAADNASYDSLQTYSTFEAISAWSQPSIGSDAVAVAELAADFSEVRLSVLGKDGKAILLDQSVDKGVPGAYLSVSAAYHGQDTVVVSWVVDDGPMRYYRAQAFTCK